MKQFIVRVKLMHPGDQESKLIGELHKAMGGKGFQQTIAARGSKYRLLDGDYVYLDSSDAKTATGVRLLAKKAIESVKGIGSKFRLFVIPVGGSIAWTNLPKAK